MSDNTITLAEARQLLAQAVETQGRDFVYTAKNADGFYAPCVNVPVTDELAKKEGWEVAADDPRRKTGCLVGTAMRLSGRIPEDGWRWYAFGTVYKFTSYLEGAAADYFYTAQSAQDRGATWGEAYDLAEASIKIRLREAADD